MRQLREKIIEALISALPITLIVYIFALLPWFGFSTKELIAFTVSAAMLVLGIGLFNMGADLAMTPMDSQMGAGLSRQRKLGLLLAVCFALGLLITVAEPDLQVLAKQVATVMNGTLLIYCVGIGVAAFLVIAVLRVVFRRTLASILRSYRVISFLWRCRCLFPGCIPPLPLTPAVWPTRKRQPSSALQSTRKRRS